MRDGAARLLEPRPRAGVAVFVAAFLGCVVGCERESAPAASPTTLRLYAGAGLRRAVEALAEGFDRETGIRVEGDFGGSGMIITRARLDPDGDLFLPGDTWYVDKLQEEGGHVKARVDVARLEPVIIVERSNPARVRSIQDLFRRDVKVGLGNAKSCQVGRIADDILKRVGRDRSSLDLKESVTVDELGVWVKSRDVDAAIVWDVTAKALGGAVTAIEIPADLNVTSTLTIALLAGSRNPGEALKFMEFMKGPGGRRILESQGFSVLPASGKRGG